MSELVDYVKRGAIAVITLRNPPVNALGAAVRQGIVDAVEGAVADDAVGALVLAGDGRCFSGGADIREFGQKPKEPILPAVIAMVEASAKPVIAAVHGTAYGGGFELPLGCHFRVAAPSAQFALPEVKLGIIPGAGGTQRLPRLIGPEKALAIILSGNPIGAEEALALGVVDEIAEGGLINAAVAFAEAKLEEGAPLRKARELEAPPPADGFFDDQRKKIERRARGLISPWHCIDSVENAVTLPFDDGLKKERAYFVKCRDSEQSKAQRHLFFAEREANKIPDVPGIRRRSP